MWKSEGKYQKRCRSNAEDQLKSERAQRLENRVQTIWFVRAGLADPSLSLRTLSDLYFELPMQAARAISHQYIGRVRDSFVEILKGMAKQEVGDLLILRGAASPPNFLPVYVQHIHDEAAMKMRSYAANTVDGIEVPAQGTLRMQ